VVVTAHEAGDATCITVRDHGPGVPAQLEPALFQRLGTGAGGGAGSTDSVGLGLWIARLLVDAHAGTVAYEPAAPGARFTVRLPRASVGAVADRTASPVGAQPSTPGRSSRAASDLTS
jgi:signal transduction histidine kinase